MNFRNVENPPTPVFLWKLLIFTVSGSLCKGIWEESAALRWYNEGGHTQEHTDRPEGYPRRVVMRRRSYSVALTEKGMWSVGTFIFRIIGTLPTRKGRETNAQTPNMTS